MRKMRTRTRSSRLSDSGMVDKEGNVTGDEEEKGEWDQGWESEGHLSVTEDSGHVEDDAPAGENM